MLSLCVCLVLSVLSLLLCVDGADVVVVWLSHVIVLIRVCASCCCLSVFGVDIVCV